MAGPQGPTLTARLGARMGPEVIASILVVAVLFVVGIIALTGQRGGSVSPSPTPSDAAVVPSASPVPSDAPATGTPPATATPVATPPPPSITPRPAAAAAAEAVRDIVDRLLEERAALEEEIARTTTDSTAIADLLRDVNASIVQMDEPLADLAADSSTSGLASRIRSVNSTTSESVRRIQHTSPRNAKTYRDGAVEVVKDLEPMRGLRAELSALVD